MPGWILVANRSLFVSTFRKISGARSAVALLVCLVVLTGCSNLRQQSLELPLPVLPSQAAVEADEVSAPVLPLGEQDAAVADRSRESRSALDSLAFENDFDAGFDQPPTVQSYLPSKNDFQPPEQLHARFVGVLEDADMTEVKLKAVSSKAAPAPAIGAALEQTNVEDCETPEVCNASESAQCACCKKKELPKLAVVEPVDPQQLPSLFVADLRQTGEDASVPVQSMLLPLRSTTITPEANVTQATNVASQASVAAPIRLIAMPDSEILEARLPSLMSAESQNKAQLLIPIAPEALKELKAESELAATRAAERIKASSTIKVSPIIELNTTVVESTPAAVAMATASEAVNSTADKNKTQAEFIPVSSSGIRVSAIPFKSLPSALPRSVSVATEPVVEQAQAAVTKMIVEPVEVAKVVQTIEPIKTVAAVGFEPKVSEAKAFVAFSKSASNGFAPALTRPSKTLPVVSKNFPATGLFANKFEAPMKQARPTLAAAETIEEGYDRLVVSSPMANIDPLADLDLPDMSQIERELEELKRENTFDPSTVIQADTIDPALLLAKLDGPPKKIVEPVAKVVDAAPDKDLITQQLAAQNSALLELQDAVKQLKPKPVKVVVKKAPELTLSNAAFCTKISGFGQFKPFAANTFSGSQKTLLYCEVENQTSKLFTSFDGSQQFETVLHGSVVILDANDQVVQTAKFPAIKDIARQQRRDFYVYFPVQFNELASGDYRLELSVEDIAGNETAVLRPFMRFTVR